MEVKRHSNERDLWRVYMTTLTQHGVGSGPAVRAYRNWIKAAHPKTGGLPE